MMRRAWIAAWLSLTLQLGPATFLNAQASKVGEFPFGPKQGKFVLFGVGLTANNEVLSLVASDTGVWELYKVSDWLTATPVVKKLSLPGYFSKRDRRDLETLGAKVFATRDATLAVCIGSAEWLRREHGWAVGKARSREVISVISLAKLSVTATANTDGLDLLEFHDARLDDEDYVLVDSSSSGHPRQFAFVRLSVPSLAAGPRCDYDWVSGSTGKQYPRPVTESSCRESLGANKIEDYIAHAYRLTPVKADLCEQNDAKFCRVPDVGFTADGRFAVGLSSEGHDNFFGSWVTTSNTLIAFSVTKRTDVAQIKAPTNDSFRTALASVNGHDYLLVIRGGTQLTVYELHDSQ